MLAPHFPRGDPVPAPYRADPEVDRDGPGTSEEGAFFARWVADWDAHMLDCPVCLRAGEGLCPEADRLARSIALYEPRPATESVPMGEPGGPLDLETPFRWERWLTPEP